MARILRVLFIGVLVRAMLPLTSLAHGSPSDPSWTDGTHDGVALGTVAVVLAASDALIAPFSLDDTAPVALTILSLQHLEERARPSWTPASIHARPPPTLGP